MNQSNMQHRTPNAEHRMAARILAHFGVRCSTFGVRCSTFDVRRSMFGVGCSMLDVFPSVQGFQRANVLSGKSLPNPQEQTQGCEGLLWVPWGFSLIPLRMA